MSDLDGFLARLRGLGIRLWVEGEALKLRAPEGVLTADLTDEIRRRKPVILALLRPEPPVAIVPLPAQESYEVSAAQRRLWVLAQFPEASAAYNIPLHQVLEGPLDRAALGTALARLVRRHESLRTTFAAVAGAPRQVVHAELPVPLAWHDISDAVAPEELARQLGREEARRPFDLTSGPLLRAGLLRLAEERHVLLFTIAHIVADGVSLGILARDLSRLYQAVLTGEPDGLPSLAFGYPAFAAWQNRLLESEAMAPHRAYWHAKLAGAPVLALPTDHPRPPLQGFVGREQTFNLPRARLEALEAFCHRRGASLFMGLHAALKVLLLAHTGQEDIVIGCVVGGRERPELVDQVGCHLNTLALRSQLRAVTPFAEFFDTVIRETREAYDHQVYPFDRLVEELNPRRDPGRSPLFDVMLVLQNQDEPGLGLARLRARPGFEHPGTSKFDLTFSFKATEAGLVLSLEYDTALFRAERIARMGRQVLTLLESILAVPDEPIGRLNLLPEDERRRLDGFNPPAPPSAPAPLPVARFEAQVARAPERTALVWPGDPDGEAPGIAARAEVSYGELNGRANRLAHQLRRLGVGRGSRVALFLEPSPDTVVAILGVWKAGGAYLPLDTAHPAERLAFVLSDARPDVLVTRRRLANRLPSPARLLCLEEDEAQDGLPERDPPCSAGPGDLAYVIYTSGSTGRPKGVQVTQANVARLFSATEPFFGFGPGDVWTLFHSYAFDFSVWEIWGALLYGGSLVVPPFWTTRSPSAFRTLLAAERVTVLNQTPSAFRQLVDWEERAAALPPLDLRLVIFGGEALDMRSLAPWVARHGDRTPRLVNMYGITETTVHVTHRQITANLLAEPASLIGRPIPDLRIHLLDEQMRPVPIGVAGEICVGGAGVARGYLNRPDLTAERFVPDPFAGDPEVLLYRSGDLGRFREDGDIEYLGRRDRQCQIRGYRVELGEIEAALEAHPGIRQAVVELRGDQRLVAWYVPAGKALPSAALRAHLRGRLPGHMLPAACVPLGTMPLTGNGKLDRDALVEPEACLDGADGHEPPRTEWEERLAALWRDVLEAPRVGRNDDFFELGGHSLKAATLVARLLGEHSARLELVEVFRQPTLAALARLAEARAASTPPHPAGPAAPSGIRPASAAELAMLDRS